MSDESAPLVAVVVERDDGFTLSLDRKGGDQWDKISFSYDTEADVVTVVINDRTHREFPLKGMPGLTGTILG